MQMGHDAAMARLAMLSGSAVVAVTGSSEWNAGSPLRLALGEEANREFVTRGSTYEMFDGPDADEAARNRLTDLTRAAAVPSTHPSVRLLMFTTNGRIERIDARGGVERIDMRHDDSMDIHAIRSRRAAELTGQD